MSTNVKTMKAITTIALIVVLLVSIPGIPGALAYAPYPLQPTDTEVANALDHLRGIQEANGCISDFSTSAWVTMAIAAAGEDPNSWSAGGNSIVDYLAANSASASSVNDYARMVLAIVAANADPADFGGVDFVALIDDAYDGTQIGDSALLNDDFWGVMALTAAGRSQSSQLVTNVVDFIKTNQNADGGWSWGVGADSDVDDTAAAIMALIAAGESQGTNVIQDGLSYIKSMQMDNGGFESWGDTNSATDSWGINSIVAAGQTPTSAYWQSGNGTDPVDDLLTFQNPDGSFNWQPATPSNMAMMAAFAIPALVAEPYPLNVQEPEESTSVNIRIEGIHETIWKGAVTLLDSLIPDDQGGLHYLSHATALGALDAASEAGGFPYVVQDMGWGLYLYSVSGEEPEGWTGWMYRVDYNSPMVGAADFVLGQTTPPNPPHEELVFYWGDWDEPPLMLTLDRKSVDLYQSFTATVTYFDDNTLEWLPLEGATVHADEDYLTTADGTISISTGQTGILDVYAECDGHIRSDKVNIKVEETDDNPVEPTATPEPTPEATATPTPTPTPVPGNLNLGNNTDGNGTILETLEFASEDKGAVLAIAQGTVALSAEGAPLATIAVQPVEEVPAPTASNIIGVAYDFGPEGATFDPPLTITLDYDPSLLPEDVVEENLVIAYFDAEIETWVELDSVVDTETHTVTAEVSHFTLFATLGAPAPAATPTPVPTATPLPVITSTPSPTITPIPTASPTPIPTATTTLAPTPTATPPSPDTASATPWGLITGTIIGVLVIGSLVFVVSRRS
ncbi:MAG: prenyltransferase/squalene oxidase repeat-containing protein [Chloroflexota bacterium]|nr:prenyltransferase/squalene oxidase repeat-containing protein [Chloroflexota bacterium]